MSLLDRAIISNNDDRLSLENVQKIFGYVDKSSYIDLLELIFKGDEELVLKHYRNLYDSGVEPNNFLNEFLEILYYIKNISNIKIEGTNFSLNDNDYKKISHVSKNIKTEHTLLFWEFTLKTIKEINLVNNPNLSIEMFLIQLMYLSNRNSKSNEELEETKNTSFERRDSQSLKINTEVVSQIKNIKQEEAKVEKKNNETINLSLIHI